jgi:hypothetical protein
MGGRQLLDPRWHWLSAALHKLYDELEDDALPSSLTIISVNDEEMVSYSIAPSTHEIDRRLIANPSALMAAAEAVTVDVTPDEVRADD